MITVRSDHQSSGLAGYASCQLVDYLRRISVCPVSSISNGSAVTGGKGSEAARSGEAVIALDVRAQRGWPKECFDIRGSLSRGQVVTINGTDERGLLFGVYEFLRRLGISYHLYGDIVPDRRDLLAMSLQFDYHGRPQFGVRGMQLWCYWFPGRSPPTLYTNVCRVT